MPLDGCGCELGNELGCEWFYKQSLINPNLETRKQPPI